MIEGFGDVQITSITNLDLEHLSFLLYKTGECKSEMVDDHLLYVVSNSTINLKISI